MSSRIEQLKQLGELSPSAASEARIFSFGPV